MNRPFAWLAGLAALMSAAVLGAETTAQVKDGRINVRGQPALTGEVITQLQKGEKVVVLEEITLPKPKTNEPAKWLRIQMPANTPVWVYAPFIDPASKSVKVARLNLRAGPGENFSVIGRLERGASVRDIRQVDNWMEIEPPAGAYAFVAANLVTRSETAGVNTHVEPAPIATTPTPAPTPSSEAPKTTPPPLVVHTERPPEAPTPSPIPAPSATPPSSSEITTVKVEPTPTPTFPAEAMSPNLAVMPPATVVVTAPPDRPTTTVVKPQPQESEAQSRRVVRREGLVRSTVSIQAPTYYELLNPENRKTINYLHASNLDVSLKQFRGRRVVVTGEEAIDPRWPKTPLIEVDSLEPMP